MPYLGTEMVKLQVSITVAQRRKLDELREKTGQSLPEIMREAVQCFIGLCTTEGSSYENKQTNEVVQVLGGGMVIGDKP